MPRYNIEHFNYNYLMFVILPGLFSGDVPGNGTLIAGTRKSGDNKSIPSCKLPQL